MRFLIATLMVATLVSPCCPVSVLGQERGSSSDGIRLLVIPDRTQFALGEVVTFTLRYENTSSDTVTLPCSADQAGSLLMLCVAGSDGMYWRYEPPDPILNCRTSGFTLKPGDVLDVRPGALQASLDERRVVGLQHPVDVPAAVLSGTSEVMLKVYPGLSTHVLEGLDSLLRMPSGCFEQTSSTTYPNALLLEYLRRTGKNTPELEERARRYLQLGYQRLLSFEVRGGGFSWFGEAPANQVLTAYGLEEFHDMARVFPIDPHVIERTRRWLLSRQRPDGSFAPDAHALHDGVTEGLTTDVLRITAYIAVALQRSAEDGALILCPPPG